MSLKIVDPDLMVTNFEARMTTSLQASIDAFRVLLKSYLNDSIRHLKFRDDGERDQLITDEIECFLTVYRKKEFEFLESIFKRIRDKVTNRELRDKGLKHLIHKQGYKLSKRDIKGHYETEINELYDRLAQRIGPCIIGSS